MGVITFAIGGGIARCLPSFLYRTHFLDGAKGYTLFGATTLSAGILGTPAGSPTSASCAVHS
jgi:hypothetical protein